MISSVQMVSVTEVTEGDSLDFYDDEYAESFEEVIDIERPFEIAEIDYDIPEGNIILINDDGVELTLPLAHKVRVIKD